MLALSLPCIHTPKMSSSQAPQDDEIEEIDVSEPQSSNGVQSVETVTTDARPEC
jgi:hypothetical protein